MMSCLLLCILPFQSLFTVEEEMEAEINQLLEITAPKKKKVPMMRMAADEEEEKITAER